MKMQINKWSTARRAWNVLRIGLLWARKGGVLRRRLMLNFPKYIKTVRHNPGADTFRYGERQLSFDDTPVIHVRMHRPSSLRFKLPHIPCINPAQVDFDFEFNDGNDEGFCYDDIARKSFLKSARDDGEEEEWLGDGDESEEVEGGNDIDMKADEFIAKFYEQMKLQRQISYLQYHETSISAE
ncbi:hypothetical protein ACET3Z_019113 [Daucus carota]